MTGAASAPGVDGRRQRSERTRQLIIEAYLALLREDPHIPTSARIAERAGYSVRSVFERFPDLLSLRIAATVVSARSYAATMWRAALFRTRRSVRRAAKAKRECSTLSGRPSTKPSAR